MSAPGGIALGKAFAKLFSEKTVKNLREASVNIERTVNGSNLQEALSIFKSIGVNLSPLSAPFQMFMAQIEAGTIESVIVLANSFIERLADPQTQANIAQLVENLNSFFGIITTISESKVLNYFLNFARQWLNLVPNLVRALIDAVQGMIDTKKKEEELRRRQEEGEELTPSTYFDLTGGFQQEEGFD